MVKVAAIQMQCSCDIGENIKKAEAFVKEAALNGAQIVLLPELFANVYFCQERRYEYYKLAHEAENDPAVQMAIKLAAAYNVVIPVSFYEKDGNSLFNSVACIDAGGKNLGIYRKTHIPDDHFYQEKFYFSPGNSGFKVFATRYGRLGVGICWDQWFSETARCLTINGAQLIMYPTAIGSEPILECDSMGHWQRCMQGHAASNIIPVIAANRIGKENVEPCESNGFQKSSLVFYGSSFMSDETGAIVCQASRDHEEILYHEYDLAASDDKRLSWGIFRDRRPETYDEILKK